VSDFDEKTRVTQVVQTPTAEEGVGNDCVVVIYSKEQTLLGRRFVLEKSPVRIGRGTDNAIVLEGDSVSRRHAHFERRTDGWYIIDDGSTNGTYVNEEFLERPGELHNNDRVKIGPTILKYLSGADAEARYHEEIYRMTIVDGLTQIYNKRYLYEALDKEWLRARRHARDLSIVMFDIDFFKRINDDFGHLAGDHVLRELAKLVQDRIRRDEVFARYGGEEFTLLLPETGLDGARALADSIRQMVEQHAFVFQNEHIPVTISLGCSCLTEEDRTVQDLIQRADEKLYEAKRQGRNRACA